MQKISSTNPSLNYKIIWEIEIDDEKSIIKKVELSRLAWEKWKNLSIENRVDFLSDIYNKMKDKKETLAQSISTEMWMPIKESRDEVQYWLNYFSWYLENASKYLNPEITYENENEIHTVFYEPKWVVVAIAPWNYPSFMFVWTCIQALLVWNSVIFKISKEVILTWKIISDIIENSILPKWVFIEVFWDWKIWDFLTMQNVDFITFTWSTNIWKKIAKTAHDKWIWCVLELWGSAPWIIHSDANIDEILWSLYFIRFSNCGQMCDWLKRLIIHEDKYEEVKLKLSNLLISKNIWITTDENTDIWPLVSESQLNNLKIQYEDAINLWAKIVYKCNIDSSLKWAYFPPTIFENINFSMKIWNEEVFWPILPIIKYKEIDEAVKLANDTNYWLWAYIFTKDKDIFKKIAKEIKSGMVQMNNVNYCIPQNPFWGYKISWIWREHGKWWFYEFTNIKVISNPK